MKSITEWVLVMAGFMVILIMSCHKNPSESTISDDGTVLVKGYVYDSAKNPLKNIAIHAIYNEKIFSDTTDSKGIYKFHLLTGNNITLSINDTCSFHYLYEKIPSSVEQNSICYYPQVLNFPIKNDTTITTTLQSVNYYPVTLGKITHFKRTDLVVRPTEMNGTTTIVDVLQECTAINNNSITYKITEDGIRIVEKVDTTTIHSEYQLVESRTSDGKITLNIPISYPSLYNRTISPNLQNIFSDLINWSERSERLRECKYFLDLQTPDLQRTLSITIDQMSIDVKIDFVENIGITNFFYRNVTNTCFVTDLQLVESPVLY